MVVAVLKTLRFLKCLSSKQTGLQDYIFFLFHIQQVEEVSFNDYCSFPIIVSSTFTGVETLVSSDFVNVENTFYLF